MAPVPRLHWQAADGRGRRGGGGRGIRGAADRAARARPRRARGTAPLPAAAHRPACCCLVPGCPARPQNCTPASTPATCCSLFYSFLFVRHRASPHGEDRTRLAAARAAQRAHKGLEASPGARRPLSLLSHLNSPAGGLANPPAGRRARGRGAGPEGSARRRPPRAARARCAARERSSALHRASLRPERRGRSVSLFRGWLCKEGMCGRCGAGRPDAGAPRFRETAKKVQGPIRRQRRPPQQCLFLALKADRRPAATGARRWRALRVLPTQKAGGEAGAGRER